MEFKITKEVYGTTAGHSGETSSSPQSATIMKLTVARDDAKLQFAKNMLTIIGVMINIALAFLVICVVTGIDLERLVVYHEVRLTVTSFGPDYFAVLYQIYLLPCLIVFFALCKSIVGSKITKEELTLV